MYIKKETSVVSSTEFLVIPFYIILYACATMEKERKGMKAAPKTKVTKYPLAMFLMYFPLFAPIH
jgi:hypothetical protein